MFIVATFPCNMTMVDGQVVPPTIQGTSIKACVAVGLTPIGQPSCPPYTHFGPGTVVSGA